MRLDVGLSGFNYDGLSGFNYVGLSCWLLAYHTMLAYEVGCWLITSMLAYELGNLGI
jgi:hypothetical protein